MNAPEVAALLTAVVGSGALVSGLVSAVKAVAFPTAWHTGRAPMVLAAVLALGAVAGTALQLGLDLAEPVTWQAIAAGWLSVYGAAVATHQTVTKVGRVVTGTTNKTGHDDAP